MVTDGIEHPTIVYKFRDSSDRSKNILVDNKLFFPSPKDLNDPYDCRVPITFDLLDTIEKKKAFAKKVLEKHKQRLITESRNLDLELLFIENEIINNFEHFKTEHNQHFSDGYDKHLGVLSLSQNWDDNLLWSHYSDSHKGFCIGISMEQVLKSNLQIGGGYITYFEKGKYPTIDPFQDDMKSAYNRLFLKSDEWDYETEYRLTKMFYPNEPLTKGERAIEFPDNCFTEIVFGHKISPENEKELIDLARKKNIKVYKTFIESGKMVISRREILY